VSPRESAVPILEFYGGQLVAARSLPLQLGHAVGVAEHAWRGLADGATAPRIWTVARGRAIPSNRSNEPRACLPSPRMKLCSWVSRGRRVVVDLRGGEPALLGLIAVVAVDGTATFVPVLVAPFDANGELQITADIDPSVSGMDITLMAWAQNRNGRGPLMDATPFVVSVQ
jgi:hypothetical protein